MRAGTLVGTLKGTLKALLLLGALSFSSACSPELMITSPVQCKNAAKKQGATIFKAFKRPNDKVPAGCSIQTRLGKKMAQFSPSTVSSTKCSTHAFKNRFECVCKTLPDIRRNRYKGYTN